MALQKLASYVKIKEHTTKTPWPQTELDFFIKIEYK